MASVKQPGTRNQEPVGFQDLAAPRSAPADLADESPFAIEQQEPWFPVPGSRFLLSPEAPKVSDVVSPKAALPARDRAVVLRGPAPVALARPGLTGLLLS
jgi:hypothetical protein